MKKAMRDDDDDDEQMMMRRLLAGFYRISSAVGVDFDHHHHHHHHHQWLGFSYDHGFEGDDDCFGDDDHADCPAQDDHDHDQQHSRLIFWETQGFLLQEILDQCNSSCAKLKEQIKRNIDIAKGSNYCNCLDNNLRGCCNNCLRHTVVNQLCTKGFNAALCKSKWQRIHNIPGGTHEYIEVLVSTKSRSKHVKFVVELGFQDEFKMAKACDEYNKLTDQLPEIYIGKTEHMNAVIRVVCDAAKKSAKERKIHLGPWRKRDFMEMKWSASIEGKFLFNSSDEHLARVSSSGSPVKVA